MSSLSQFSDNMLIVMIMSYLLAMMLHAAEYAFGRSGVVARASQAPARELVGAGGPPVTELPDGLATEAATGPAKADRIGRIALWVTWFAVAAHATTLVTRSLAAGRVPWGNMYEFVLTVTLIGAVSWLVIAANRPRLRHLGLFVTLVMVLLTGLAGMVLHVPVGPLVPALDSYWFVVHVGAAALSSGLFLVGFVAAVLYLLRAGYDQGRRGGLYAFGERIADAATVERLAFRMTAFAFPIWTFAVTAGAIWAEASWGRYWGWDPKETWAFISWIAYAGYLHARATPSIKRTLTAWFLVLAWATMMMNLFGVNIFFEGLHSYGGVK